MKSKNTYTGEQYDDVEKLLDDAEKLVRNPITRQEGRDLMRIAEIKLKRETNQLVRAKLDGQAPNIPALEPSQIASRLKHRKA